MIGILSWRKLKQKTDIIQIESNGKTYSYNIHQKEQNSNAIILMEESEINTLAQLNKFPKIKELSFIHNLRGELDLTVYKDDIVRFDEVNCSALYCLPVADVQLTASDIPKQISIKGYDGSVESVIKITDVQYSYDKSVTPILNIVISGEKVSGSNSNYDMISYKLYDNSGHLVDSGNIHLRSLSKGDKFKDDSVSFYDAVPGETYNIVFSEYSW